ncbi:MAG: hypothetical protein A2V77_16830 [Anaeromyxobacter sp. RBG_16_69_14]|nr:MAG: hypothetical protein A2V77_16830 [Anaeromyxobacter sp. RBG_16_69_14]
MTLTREPPVYRPPSEADSLILQVTVGCSHNRCTFCSMYRTKSFRAIALEQIRAEISEARRLIGPDVPRVFLADGDAMCLSARRLTEILDALGEVFPRLRRVGTYANARDVLRKSDDELDELRRRKLAILYIGLESGDDATLVAVEKGATVAEMVEAGQRAKAAGMAVSVMVQVGLAGRERSLLHARLSAEAVNRMEPTYTALLTYTPTPDSPLFERVGRGELELPGPLESLEEIREFVRGLSCRTYLTCNHPSNYLPLEGRMPSAQRDILLLLEGALAGRIQIRPEFLRGL